MIPPTCGARIADDDSGIPDLYAAILSTAFDDLAALSNNRIIRNGGRVMDSSERAALRDELQRWFFSKREEGPTSLSRCCDVTGLDSDAVRDRIRRGGSIKIRGRCQLGKVARKQILKELAQGVSATQLSQTFHVDVSTIREVRLRAEAGAGAHAA